MIKTGQNALRYRFQEYEVRGLINLANVLDLYKKMIPSKLKY